MATPYPPVCWSRSTLATAKSGLSLTRAAAEASSPSTDATGPPTLVEVERRVAGRRAGRELAGLHELQLLRLGRQRGHLCPLRRPRRLLVRAPRSHESEGRECDKDRDPPVSGHGPRPT